MVITLLDQAASHLNCQHAVIGLQSSALHLVAKNGIFESREIKTRCVLHDSGADMPCKLVRDHAVAEIDKAS